MQTPQSQENLDYYKKLTKEAINLANQGRWLEAVNINQLILTATPNDIDALNRLGKGFSEIGQYKQAENSFRESLILSPSNVIAKKNLERLQHLEDAPPPQGTPRTTPHIFIEESGKSYATVLRTLVSKETLALVSPGETLSLLVDGASVYAISNDNVPLGQLEPKIASLMIKLFNIGNKYVVAVAANAKNQLSVIIREIYRHPDMKSSVSFPISNQNGGDYLQFTGEGSRGRKIEHNIMEDLRYIDDLEPEVDASTEETDFNQVRTNRGRIDLDEDEGDEE